MPGHDIETKLEILFRNIVVAPDLLNAVFRPQLCARRVFLFVCVISGTTNCKRAKWDRWTKTQEIKLCMLLTHCTTKSPTCIQKKAAFASLFILNRKRRGTQKDGATKYPYHTRCFCGLGSDDQILVDASSVCQLRTPGSFG